MPRLPRRNLPAFGTYHVFNRGVEQRAICLDDDDRRLFVSLLRMATRRFVWTLDAFTLLDNHFHLVVTTHLERLSDGMHSLGFRYARAFNDRYVRVGHLFQGRFGAQVIETDEQFFATCGYVFENPVRAGLCARLDEYRWSGGDYLPLYVGERLAPSPDSGYALD